MQQKQPPQSLQCCNHLLNEGFPNQAFQTTGREGAKKCEMFDTNWTFLQVICFIWAIYIGFVQVVVDDDCLTWHGCSSGAQMSIVENKSKRTKLGKLAKSQHNLELSRRPQKNPSRTRLLYTNTETIFQFEKEVCV